MSARLTPARSLVVVGATPRPFCPACDGKGVMAVTALVFPSGVVPAAGVTPCLHCSPPRGWDFAAICPQHLDTQNRTA